MGAYPRFIGFGCLFVGLLNIESGWLSIGLLKIESVLNEPIILLLCFNNNW